MTLRWWQIAAVIVAFEYFACLALGSVVGFHYSIPMIGIAGSAALLSVTILLCYAFVRVAQFAASGEPSPIARLASDLKRASSDLLLVIFLASCQIAVLTWFKVTMPHAVGFWADPLLANLDASLFGADPWRIAHRLPSFIAPIIDWGYLSWGLLCVTTLFVVGLASDGPIRDRALISYFLFVCLSAFGQYLLPSVGPIFYEAQGLGSRFAELPLQPNATAAANYLWQNQSDPLAAKMGVGVSAMPSVHVAGSVWMALTIGSFLPRLKWATWAYAAFIFFGSVYLGWHYAVDGLAGASIALAAWSLAPASKPLRRRVNVGMPARQISG